MPTDDAARWDARYREDDRYARFGHPRDFLVENLPRLPAGGLALDAAMGLGANAGYLIEHGWQVIGVDISGVAVRDAHRRYPSLMAVQADLTHFNLPPARFDLIMNFYYLQRDLWPKYLLALKLDGWLMIETLTQEMLSIQPDIDPNYLLSPGELLEAFSGKLEIVDYREGWIPGEHEHPRAVASLLGHKR